MLHELIRNARRRLLFNEVLKQFAFSAALAIAALAVLLTVGTRYLQWWIVAVFAAGVAVWAIVKLRKTVPGEYAAAVWLDDKAGLHDALSTAHYFASSGKKARTLPPEAEAILRAQREQAESAAGEVNVAMAVPFRFPRALYGLAALLLISSGLIGLRYFYGHGLNLSAPIYEVMFQDLAAKSQVAKSGKNAARPKDYDEAESLLSKLGLGSNLEEKPDENLDQALADALRAGDQAASAEDASPSDDKGDPLDAPNSPPEDKNSTPGDQKSSDSQNNQNASKQNTQSDKSLLSKLKDAMDNMLGKPADQNEKGDNPSQSKSGGQDAQDGPKEGQQGGQTAKMPADGDTGEAKKSDSPGQTSAGKGEKTEGPAVAGADDGDKAIKAAAQLKAMGKISELIGKRSGQVTGESMIDVQSGDQRLRTAYKDKSAAHGEGTGEVSRDQIPLSEQEYVQQYFQQVRKPAAKAATPAPTGN
jgi:hypothetical protein